MLKQKQYDKPYEVNNNSTIFFGKHKGLKHEVLKDEENRKYCEWVLSTEEGFAEPTKEYIKKHIKF